MQLNLRPRCLHFSMLYSFLVSSLSIKLKIGINIIWIVRWKNFLLHFDLSRFKKFVSYFFNVRYVDIDTFFNLIFLGMFRMIWPIFGYWLIVIELLEISLRNFKKGFRSVLLKSIVEEKKWKKLILSESTEPNWNKFGVYMKNNRRHNISILKLQHVNWKSWKNFFPWNSKIW